MVDALRTSIEEANRVIVLRRQNPAFGSMGTTVVGVLINGNQMVITHAGDSRAYLIRGGEIQQLTVDHTYVQDLVDRGAITPEDALSHPQSHVLTKCLGAETRVELETLRFKIWELDNGIESDSLLLCSDGLYSLVMDDEIADMVSRYSPQEASVKLVELAKTRGGFDNITVVIMPLGGRLHEDKGGGHVHKLQSTGGAPVRAEAKNSFLFDVTMGQIAILMVILVVVGGLVGVLYALSLL